MKHEGSTWDRLSSHQHATLGIFEDLLRTMAIPRGMVARSDADRLHERHVLDCLRGVPFVPADAVRVCDLGSGAGLPGIPVAVAEAGIEVTLSETRRRRVAFLELAVERLGLSNAVVRPGAAEDLPPLHFDACFARGFAGATQTWAVAAPLLTAGGSLLYWAGRSFRLEDAPSGVRAQVVTPPLESGGPIVIMTRQ